MLINRTRVCNFTSNGSLFCNQDIPPDQTHSYISDCGGLPAPSNGEIDLPDVTAVGQIVVYSCFTGYALDTAAIRTCLSSGQWSGNAPQCVSGKDKIYIKILSFKMEYIVDMLSSLCLSNQYRNHYHINIYSNRYKYVVWYLTSDHITNHHLNLQQVVQHRMLHPMVTWMYLTVWRPGILSGTPVMLDTRLLERQRGFAWQTLNGMETHLHVLLVRQVTQFVKETHTNCF